MLTYLALITLITVAHFAGLLISHFSREELKIGRRYFLIALRVLFCVIVTLFCYSIGLFWWLAAPLVALTLAFMLWRRSNEMFERRPAYAQLSLGIMAAALLVGKDVFPLAAALFVSGLLLGSLDTAIAFEKKKPALLRVASHAALFVFAAVIFGLFLNLR
jgi:hypothetical protein